MRRALRRSLLVAAIATLMMSLVPLFVAPAAADGCDDYGAIQWKTSIAPAPGGTLIVRSGEGDQVSICYSGGAVTEVYIDASFGYALGAVSGDIVAPEWQITGANSPKPAATLKMNSNPDGGNGRIVLPGGSYGTMQIGTTVSVAINYNNGNITIRLDGTACSNPTTCFKFKSEIKGHIQLD